jgi:hypothetical protein
MKKITLLLLTLSLTIFAFCEKDFIEDNAINANLDEVTPGEISQKEGRMYFPSQEIFTQEYVKFQDKDDDEIYKLASKMHGKGFIPLRPIITEENEEFVLKQLKTRNEKLRKKVETRAGSNLKLSDEYVLNHLDDLEDIIGDEAFSNFLNTEAEVQIGNQIYKYTDVGLFITEDTNYDKLENYLKVNDISDDLLLPTSNESKIRIKNEIPQGGFTPLGNNIIYFSAPIDLKRMPVDPGGGGGGTPPTPEPDQTLEDFLDDLDNCSPSSGLFGGIFGTNKVCIDEYESGRRVKTKAYNYNYAIAFNIGVKVKHQKKGWTGIWRKEDVDEIVLGVEYAKFEYSFMPIFAQALSTIDLTETFMSPLSSKPYSGTYQFTTNVYGNYANVDYTYTPNNPYPFDLFQSDLIIETWSHNDAWDRIFNEEINGLTKAEKLNDYFWENTWNYAKSELKDLTNDPNVGMPDDIICASKHPEVGKICIFQTLKRRKNNGDKIEKTFDWGVGIQLTLNSSNNYHLLKGNVGAPSLQKPKNFHASLYGAVKRNGKWHGSKFKF